MRKTSAEIVRNFMGELRYQGLAAIAGKLVLFGYRRAISRHAGVTYKGNGCAGLVGRRGPSRVTFETQMRLQTLTGLQMGSDVKRPSSSSSLRSGLRLARHNHDFVFIGGFDRIADHTDACAGDLAGGILTDRRAAAAGRPLAAPGVTYAS